jgi:hypothetical protein
LGALGSTAERDDWVEARAAPRRRVLKAAVAFNERRVTISVAVRALSPTGAKVRCEASTSIPDHFVLIVELDGLEADCEVVWRHAHEVGARFLGPPRSVRPKRLQVVQAVTPANKPTLRKKPLDLPR